MQTFKKTDDQTKAVQLLSSPARFIMLFGGSRSGKTFINIFAIVIRALKAPESRHIILRLAFNHVKTSVWKDTFPKVMKICFPGVRYKSSNTDFYVEFFNGSTIWFGGLDDKERTEKILGNEYATVYFNEVSQISYSSVQLALTRLAQKIPGLINKAYFDCNPPSKAHWAYKVFVLNEDPMSKQKLREDLYACMLMNPDGNRENISSDYIETFLDTMSEAQRNRFKFGQWSDDGNNTIFKEVFIHRNRISQAPQLKRIVIGVDPAVTAKKDSDETGIVAAGIGFDGRAYVLDDLSGIYTPLGWGNKVVNSFANLRADKVVAESNQGGDLVQSNIQHLDHSINVKLVHAKRGKVLRAEPIAALYEHNMVSHVGTLPGLESEMITWEPQNSDISPGRIDALVYALTDLMLGEVTINTGGSRAYKTVR